MREGGRHMAENGAQPMRLLLTLGVLLAGGAAFGCGEGEQHPDFVGDPPLTKCEDESCANGGLAPPADPEPVALTCQDEDDLPSDVGDPLTGPVEAFATSFFNIEMTEPISGDYEVRAHGLDPRHMACAKGGGSSAFSLLGGSTDNGSKGPLLLLPEDDAFWPTMIQQAPTRNQDLMVVPVFSVAHIQQIFDDTGIEPDPDKAHILVEAVNNGQMGSDRALDVAVSSASAAAVAYSNGGTWSTSLDETGADGLAALLNIDAFDQGMGEQVELGFVNSALKDEDNDGTQSVWVIAGAVTYFTLYPFPSRTK